MAKLSNMKTKLLYLILLVLSLVSCNTDEEISEHEIGLLGAWISPVYQEDSVITFTKTKSIKADEYGIEFQKQNKLTERKNSGWCGTPPIAYANYTGQWNIGDGLITIQVPFWGGESSYVWKILSLTSESLKVKQIEVNYNFKE